MSSWIGKLAVACAAALMAGSGWASGHREVLRIQCGQGMALAFEARPYDGNMAGSSSVARRYVVHGPGNRVRMAPHLWFERYYANLYHLLPTHPDTLRTTRLRIATDGLAHPGGRFDVADTLYLPPEQFSRIEFETLAACVTGQADSIRQALGEVQIQSRTLLGLMRTHAGFGVNGIARLIHEPVPVAGVYAGSGSQFLLVAHDGTATLRRNYTSNNAMPPPRVVGRVVQGRGKRRTLRHLPMVRLADQTQEQAFETLAGMRNAAGQRLRDDYDLEPETWPDPFMARPSLLPCKHLNITSPAFP